MDPFLFTDDLHFRFESDAARGERGFFTFSIKASTSAAVAPPSLTRKLP